MSEVDPETILWIGADIGGVSAWTEKMEEAIRGLSHTARERQRGLDASGLRMQVVFQVPGPLWAPNRQGIRFRSYARTNRAAIVVVAIPTDLDPASAPAYLSSTMSSIAEGIPPFVARRRLDLATGPIVSLLAGLASDDSAAEPVVA